MKRILISLTLLILTIVSCTEIPSYTTIQKTADTASDLTKVWLTPQGEPPITYIRYQGTILQSNTEVYFSQQNQDPSIRLVQLYGSCNQTLDIAVYSLTHPQIVNAIREAHNRGVRVRIITDKVQASGNTQKHAMNDLLTLGIPIKIDTHSGLMHLKMSIIDRSIATTGSYNYSLNASEDNDEMLVVIKELWFAEICQSEFERMWSSPQFVDLGMSY